MLGDWGGVGWSSGGGLDGLVFTMGGGGMGGGSKPWCGGLQHCHQNGMGSTQWYLRWKEETRLY